MLNISYYKKYSHEILWNVSVSSILFDASSSSAIFSSSLVNGIVEERQQTLTILFYGSDLLYGGFCLPMIRIEVHASLSPVEIRTENKKIILSQTKILLNQ